MTLVPTATAERRQKEAADASLIDAAFEVVTAHNAVRWVASWVDREVRSARQADLDGAIARLREVVLRQASER